MVIAAKSMSQVLLHMAAFGVMYAVTGCSPSRVGRDHRPWLTWSCCRSTTGSAAHPAPARSSLTKVFLDYDQKALDDQYEQRLGEECGGSDRALRRAQRRGSQTDRPPRIERYGSTAPETLDLYGSGTTAFVFVHGGAWKRQRSWENAFAAEPIVSAGAAYVALNFALLPTVTLPEMADQVCRGIEWVRATSPRTSCCAATRRAPTSALAHSLRLEFVRKALLVSGIYDLCRCASPRATNTYGSTSGLSTSIRPSATSSASAVP